MAAGIPAAYGLTSGVRLGVAPKKLHILILGGTAYLGPEVVEAAMARGHTVTLFNRGRTRPELFGDLEKLQGNRDPEKHAIENDPTSPKGLTQLQGRRFDAVIDNSGYVPRIVRASAELLAPNTGYYLFVSTVSVYKRDDVPHDDESGELATMEDPTNENVQAHYGALKALCEQAMEAVMPGRCATVRPGLIVGPGDWTNRWMYWPRRISEGGEVLAPGDGTDRVQLIDVRDLAEFMVKMIEEKTTGTFNTLGPQGGLTMREMLEQVRKGVGSDASFTWVDTAFLQSQKVSAWMDMPLWIPMQGSYAGIGTRSVARAEKAGLRFRPVSETAKAALDWYAGLTDDQKQRYGGRFSREREREVLAAWRDRDR